MIQNISVSSLSHSTHKKLPDKCVFSPVAAAQYHDTQTLQQLQQQQKLGLVAITALPQRLASKSKQTNIREKYNNKIRDEKIKTNFLGMTQTAPNNMEHLS